LQGLQNATNIAPTVIWKIEKIRFVNTSAAFYRNPAFPFHSPRVHHSSVVRLKERDLYFKTCFIFSKSTDLKKSNLSRRSLEYVKHFIWQGLHKCDKYGSRHYTNTTNVVFTTVPWVRQIWLPHWLHNTTNMARTVIIQCDKDGSYDKYSSWDKYSSYSDYTNATNIAPTVIARCDKYGSYDNYSSCDKFGSLKI
jgi:hypothetical protein